MTTFYVVCAGAAATLVGLLFVAVQIGPPLVRSGAVGPRHARARSTFTIFAVVFFLSLYFVAPFSTSKARGVVALGAAAGIVRAVRTWIPLWRNMLRGRTEARLWQTA